MSNPNQELSEKLTHIRTSIALQLRPYSDMRFQAFRATGRYELFTKDDLATLTDVIEALSSQEVVVG